MGKRNKIQDTITKIQDTITKIMTGVWLLVFICTLYLGTWLFSSPANAEEDVLTKGDAVRLLSATDFVKKKIGQLMSWTIGYDLSKVNKIRLTPSINYIKALPHKVPPDGRTVFDIVASVDDPSGLANISGVRADLSGIGRLSNTVLVDNGQFGDEVAGDGLYTLQTNVPPRIQSGAKEIPIAVANKEGWLAVARTNLDISKNPIIIEVKAIPESVKADGSSSITIRAKLDNPGRIEDLEIVSLDLSDFGVMEPVLMQSDNAQKDIFQTQFVVPSSVAAGEYALKLMARNIISGTAVSQVVVKVNK